MADVKITFFETFGDPKADGECTVLREGCAELAIAEDTLMNAVAGNARARINDCDYILKGPADGCVWAGTVNPDTRRQRQVRFAELVREDGTLSSPRIVVLQGELIRGEAVLDLRKIDGTQAFANESMVCFTRGSRILTAFGDLPVQDLRVGDLVHTVDHGLQPIRWIGARDVTETRMRVAPHLQPVKICRNAFGPGLPATDIWVSPNHRMMLEAQNIGQTHDILAPAKGLENGQSIFIDTQLRDTQYIHLLFDEHEMVFVEGMPSESFYPCPSSLMSLKTEDRKRVFELMPQLENHPLSYGPLARPAIAAHEARILAA